ncbi:NAD(P)-dependent alcohol dehydrogenase [Microbispora cellulosiformans]|uniref:NAD(P)-dependent alcohol dehydrogenase n=1 Tax=Microbispora cellulosiformans TaxID=2614688 RepID=A0A5J5K2J0_9ACTN|nr:NAD(P)-dependent alcohol dehydrogenase [Microbispora cellulosiformans]KAA9377172.1 NAD(P)-dependent alcohol dehydrogenase [Microbispora cellulosiformans]
MKAYVLRSYGPPEVLELGDVPTPAPGPGEVLVRVRATSVQPYDWHHMRGEPYVARLMGGTLGPRGPRIGILGADVAGEVEATGAGVTAFRPGDQVFAMVTGGGFAEYVSVRESELVRKPENLSFEQAAAVPLAAATALLALDEGQVRPGHEVLVNGASGGVGTFAVQLARAFGAEVTGVCGPRNVDLVRSLGAGEVVDYSRADFTRTARRYDLLLDIAGTRPAAACRRVLRPRGTHVLVGGPAGRWLQPVGHTIAALSTSPFTSRRVVLADVTRCREKRAKLVRLAALVEQGDLTPVVDRVYPFDDLPAAVRYVEEGHARGKVVVSV